MTPFEFKTLSINLNARHVNGITPLFKTFSINLNAQHVNGMTPFNLALITVIRYSKVAI